MDILKGEKGGVKEAAQQELRPTRPVQSPQSTAAFCNESGNQSLVTSTPTIFFVNELTIESDGWAMIAPFGDYPSEALLPTADGKLKRQRAIQRITRESAEGMVAQFHNSRAGLKKFIRGCNIYVGHPDMPGLESRYPDKEPKGVFADMEVRERGVYGLPVFTSEGMELVEGRKLVNGQRVRGFSGRLVEATPDGEAVAEGRRVPVFVPTKIASAGLTASPHLPVEFFNEDDTLAEEPNPHLTLTLSPPIRMGAEREQDASADGKLKVRQATTGNSNLNDEKKVSREDARNSGRDARAPQTTTTTKMKTQLLKLCTLLGIEFANEADDARMETALEQIEGKITTMTSERDEARKQFANERVERIADEIDRAIMSGRITDAEKITWGKRLEAQFANEVTAIRELAAKIKTTSVTISRGQRRDQIDLANPRQRQQFVNELLSEIAAEQRLDPVRHSKRILNLARERHPVLFDVPHVEIRTPGKAKN
ncbi:MAG TPA: hypothetical protein VGN23_07555 [Verrucomicrobiae bacterium]|jgi:hypothetical protein